VTYGLVSEQPPLLHHTYTDGWTAGTLLTFTGITSIRNQIVKTQNSVSDLIKIISYSRQAFATIPIPICVNVIISFFLILSIYFSFSYSFSLFLSLSIFLSSPYLHISHPTPLHPTPLGDPEVVSEDSEPTYPHFVIKLYQNRINENAY
jgi:hypothetical protein